MEKEPTVLQTGIKFGLITGMIMIFYTVILYVIGESMNMWLGAVSFIITIVLMVLGMREFKQSRQGYLEFKEGLGVGTIIIAISSLIHQIFNFVYMNFIDTSILGEIEEKTREMMEKFGMDEDKIEQAVTETTERLTSPISILYSILWVVVIGFIISLILAAIMQKKRSELDGLDAG